MILGATQSSFKYLDLKTNFNIHYDPLYNPDILWAHYSYDQPIYQNKNLHNIKNIVCVSDWQKQMFVKYLNIPKEKIKTIRNGGSDNFKYNKTPKSKTFIYTSTPFRGLEYIPAIWKKIIAKHPDAKLKVFSSMKLYNQEDTEEYKQLYKTINSLPNAQHFFPVSHKELSTHLEDAAIFLYPNNWEETSCVSLIEAMRSGCVPILSDIGALSETANGFGKLIKINGINTSKGWKLDSITIDDFAHTAIELLDKFDTNNPYYDKISNFATNYYDWDQIRIEWYDYLKEIKMNTQIQPVLFEDAVAGDYVNKTKDFVLKWSKEDKEFSQTTSNFQIEKFIAMNYHTLSHAYENILRNRKAAAMNLFNKSVEMTEKQREFEMRWKDSPKDQAVRWEDDSGNRSWVWYDLDTKKHEIYMSESENALRDACFQLETYDKILETLVVKNGGAITREQFNNESAENWERTFQTKIFDEMLSRQTGVTPNIFNSYRNVMAQGIIDPNKNTVGFDPNKSFDKAISNPNEFMTEMSKGIEKTIEIYSDNTPVQSPQLENWFNEDVKK